ncbi:MAG: hypothetical protein KDA79_02560 [Planctomycetaceae bacterium]|nr:hypothetical protein [Planctomycetaceae bacterium]
MSDGQSRSDRQPHQLDELLRDFYAREMRKGLPAELRTVPAGDFPAESAAAAAVPVPAVTAAPEHCRPVVSPGEVSRAGVSASVRNDAGPDGARRSAGRTVRLRQADEAGTTSPAGKRAGVAAVTVAACCLLAVAFQLPGRSGLPDTSGTDRLGGPQAAALPAESEVVGRSEAARQDRPGRQPVERSGRSRTDARTDGVPVMLGQPERNPASGGLEIEVPEDSIEVFPIDDPERPRDPAARRPGAERGPDARPKSSDRPAARRPPVVAPTGK